MLSANVTRERKTAVLTTKSYSIIANATVLHEEGEIYKFPVGLLWQWHLLILKMTFPGLIIMMSYDRAKTYQRCQWHVPHNYTAFIYIFKIIYTITCYMSVPLLEPPAKISSLCLTWSNLWNHCNNIPGPLQFLLFIYSLKYWYVNKSFITKIAIRWNQTHLGQYHPQGEETLELLVLYLWPKWKQNQFLWFKN